MFLCMESICILAGKAGRYFRDAILPSWNPCSWQDPGSDHGPGLMGLPVIIESWVCDLCEKIGKGDANSFFALEEIDHFLEFRCRGSLRRHKVPEPASDLLSREELDSDDDPSRQFYGARVVDPGSFGIRHDTVVDIQPLPPPTSPTEPTTERTIVIGLGQTWVEAGQTLFINAGTREAFKAERLIVPSSVASHFMIEGMSTRSHQILESRCPAILFTEAWQQCLHLKCDVVCDGFITVAVTNMSRRGASFQGAVMGPAIVEPGHSVPHGPLSGGARIADRELTALLAKKFSDLG